ncbi:MAG: phosphatase PAP2 family protein [Ferruginibacter sp.]
MNNRVIQNYSKLSPVQLLWPLLVLSGVSVFLFANDALNASGYIQSQKELFYLLNASLGQFPALQFNLTQLGDALIFLSLLSLFIVYAPSLWQSLISASLFSLIASSGLKNLFSIPRPAAVLDTNSFIIIGDTLPGHSSLPSGHAITIFTTLTILLFAFMPEKKSPRAAWCLLVICLGFVLAFTRVGVGAHFPIDVIVGCMVGFLCGLAGIFFSRSYALWHWVGNKKYHPVFIVLLLACVIMVFLKTTVEPLPVYIITLISLVFSLYKITDVYIKK